MTLYLLYTSQDSNPDSLWEWVDGSKLDYSKWCQDSEKGAQPTYCCPEDAPSHCGTLGSNKEWFDTACTGDQAGSTNYYICQKEKGLLNFLITSHFEHICILQNGYIFSVNENLFSCRIPIFNPSNDKLSDF